MLSGVAVGGIDIDRHLGDASRVGNNVVTQALWAGAGAPHQIRVATHHAGAQVEIGPAGGAGRRIATRDRKRARIQVRVQVGQANSSRAAHGQPADIALAVEGDAGLLLQHTGQFLGQEGLPLRTAQVGVGLVPVGVVGAAGFDRHDGGDVLIRHGALHIALAQPAGLAWGGNTVEKIQHWCCLLAVFWILHLDLHDAAHRRGFYVEALDVETLIRLAVDQTRFAEIPFVFDRVWRWRTPEIPHGHVSPGGVVLEELEDVEHVALHRGVFGPLCHWFRRAVEGDAGAGFAGTRLRVGLRGSDGGRDGGGCRQAERGGQREGTCAAE